MKLPNGVPKSEISTNLEISSPEEEPSRQFAEISLKDDLIDWSSSWDDNLRNDTYSPEVYEESTSRRSPSNITMIDISTPDAKQETVANNNQKRKSPKKSKKTSVVSRNTSYEIQQSPKFSSVPERAVCVSSSPNANAYQRTPMPLPHQQKTSLKPILKQKHNIAVNAKVQLADNLTPRVNDTCIRCKGNHQAIKCRAIGYQRVPGFKRCRISIPYEKAWNPSANANLCQCCNHSLRRISLRDDAAYANYLYTITKLSMHESLDKLIYQFGNVPVDTLVLIKQETAKQLRGTGYFEVNPPTGSPLRNLCNFFVRSILRTVWKKSISELLPLSLEPNPDEACDNIHCPSCTNLVREGRRWC